MCHYRAAFLQFPHELDAPFSVVILCIDTVFLVIFSLPDVRVIIVCESASAMHFALHHVPDVSTADVAIAGRCFLVL